MTGRDVASRRLDGLESRGIAAFQFKLRYMKNSRPDQRCPDEYAQPFFMDSIAGVRRWHSVAAAANAVSDGVRRRG